MDLRHSTGLEKQFVRSVIVRLEPLPPTRLKGSDGQRRNEGIVPAATGASQCSNSLPVVMEIDLWLHGFR